MIPCVLFLKRRKRKSLENPIKSGCLKWYKINEEITELKKNVCYGNVKSETKVVAKLIKFVPLEQIISENFP